MDEDAGAGNADRRFVGTLSLYKNAAVLTHQRTVRKDRRFYQDLQVFYLHCRLLLGIERPHELFAQKMFQVWAST